MVIRNNYHFKVSTLTESPRTDTCNTVGDRDTGQIGAIHEGRLTDTSDAVRNSDARQIYTVTKGRMADASDVNRNGIISLCFVFWVMN